MINLYKYLLISILVLASKSALAMDESSLDLDGFKGTVRVTQTHEAIEPEDASIKTIASYTLLGDSTESTPQQPESNSKHNIFEVKTSQEIIKHLENIENCTIFCDIDNTIIMPVSKNSQAKIFQEIKNTYIDSEVIISNWRLQRKLMLIDNDWPDVINILKQSYPVYGLTEVESGKYGNIPSMEEWRFGELQKLDIKFTVNSEIQEFKTLFPLENNPVFYNGIFVAGDYSKGQVLKAYQTVLSPQFIVAIDDRIEKLQEIGIFCHLESIGFLGIHFKGAETFYEQPNDKVASFQKEYLVKQNKWLEDIEAAKLMEMQNSENFNDYAF